MDQIVLIIIITNVLVSLKGFNNPVFFDKFKFQISKINAGEKIRMISSGFLHADWMHLGFNMYTLWIFGKIVTNHFGAITFIIIYFISLLAGNLYSLYNHKNNPYYAAIGASGAVSGIVFSAILLEPGLKLMIFPIPISLPGYIFGIGYLLYSIYGMKKQLGAIGHDAHLGGAIGGFLLTLILNPSVLNNNTLMIGVMGVIIAGLFIFGDKITLNK